MRILHLSDLHFGKKFKMWSFIDDQKEMIQTILNVIDEKHIDTVLMCGDIYDRSIPSIEAVNLFDEFLVELSNRNLNILISSGNHDSADRLAFGNQLMLNKNIYISPVYDGQIDPVVLKDSYGDINFYMLPYVKSSTVKHYFPEENIVDYNDALQVATDAMHINPTKRNIILSHQFVMGSQLDGSEEIIEIGGLDQVSSNVYQGFDYVALGHIHRPQNVKGKHIRYCGTALKYAFDEQNQQKTLTILEIKDKKDEIIYEYIPVSQTHEFVTLEGKFNDLLLSAINDEANRDNFIEIVLTDEQEVPGAFGQLADYYHRISKLTYKSQSRQDVESVKQLQTNPNTNPLQIVMEFYKGNMGKELTDEQKEYLTDLSKQIWEEGN